MDKHQLQLLIVHNDEKDCTVINNLISKVDCWTCTPQWTTTYKTALAAMVDNRHEVYLVEYSLNKRNGLELLLEAVNLGCQSPIILLVKQKDCEIEAKLKEMGTVNYLVKDQLSVPLLEYAIHQALNYAKTLKALREKEEHHSQSVKLSSDGIVIHCEGKVVFLNPAGAKIIGAANPELLIGKSIRDFVHVNYQKIVQSRIRQTEQEKQQTELIEEKFIRLDGEIIDVEVTSIPVNYRGKAATQVFFKDITNRKEARTEREELLAAEREQRELVEALNDIAIALNSTLDLDELLECILMNVERVVPHDAADIMLIGSDMVRVASSQGYMEHQQATMQGASVSLTNFPILQRLAKTKQPLIILDTDTNSDWVQIPETVWVRSYIGAPFWIKDQVVGFLNLNSGVPGFYSETHARHLQAFAHQASIAVGNARLLEAERKQRELAEALREAGLALSSTLDFDVVLDRLLDQIARVIPYDAANVMLVKEGHIRFVRARGYEQFGANVIQNMVHMSLNIETTSNLRQMFKTQQPMVIADIAVYPDWVRIPTLTHIHSWVGAPILAQGQVIAFFSLDKTEPGFYQPQHAELLTVFAGQASLALENARLFNAEAHRRREAEILHKATTALTSALDLGEVLDNILTQLGQVVPYDSACVFLHQDNKLTAVAARGFLDQSQIVGHDYPVDNALFQELLQNQQPFYLADAQADSSFKGWGNATHVRGWLGIPLIVRRSPIGCLTLDSRQVAAYGQTEVALGQTFANQAAVAIANAQLFEQTQIALVEAEGLYQVSRALIGLEHLPDLLQIVADQVVDVLPATWVALVTLDMEAQQRKEIVISGPETNITSTNSFEELMDGLTGWVVRERQPALSPKGKPDARESPAVQKNRAEGGFGAVIVVPLHYREKILGTMTAINRLDERDFTERDVKLMVAMANQTAIAVENVRLFEQAQQHATELEVRVLERTFELQTLYELAQALGHTTQLYEVIRLTLLQLYQAFPHDVSASLLLTDTTNTLTIQSQHALAAGVETQIQEHLLKTLSRMRGLMVDKATLETNHIQPRTRAKLKPALEKLQTFETVPILIGETIMGLLLVATEKETTFDKEQVRLLHIVANQAAGTIGRLQSLLAAEHQRLENLVAHLPNGVIQLDSEQRIVLANEVAKKLMIPLTSAQVGDKLTSLGRHAIEIILKMSPTKAPFVIELGGIPQQVFQITSQPITAGPEVGGATLVLRDVTEERVIQKRIQQQERVAAVGQLAAGIAHDFNNILTSIIGYAELLLLNPTLSPETISDLERITNQGHRAAHLVRQILDFSRQTITEKQPLDLLSFVKETVKLLERTIPEDIHISIKIDAANRYIITADLTQMQQALTNLAVNARDAMPTGGDLQFELSRLVLSPDKALPHPDIIHGHWVVLTISDTGAGIPAKLQGQIFEPFFTTKEVGKGTGLGLAQVYGVIKQHEGHIDVKSKEGFGTTFTLYFPELASLQKFAPRKTISEMPRGQGEVILLVEDDSSVLTISRTMLKHLGYHVLTATNGYEALEVYNQHQNKIALVLTDLTMPGMGGTELALTLRKQNPAIKVIALTGYPLNRGSKEALTRGIADWIQKPLDLKRLAQTINRLLNEEVIDA